MEHWYSTWKEAKKDLFAKEPKDPLGNMLRKYFDRKYEYEAHEWHKVVVTPENKKWALAQIKEDEERAVQSILMDWEDVVCEARDGSKWHAYGWRTFAKTLRIAYAYVKMDGFGNTDASEACDVLKTCLTFDGVFDFEWRLERFCEFVADLHGGSVPIVKDGAYVANKNECELRLIALSHIMGHLHDCATVLMTISGMMNFHGLSLSTSGSEIVHNGVFECERTLAEIQDSLPESGLSLAGCIVERLNQIKTISERGAESAERAAVNASAAFDEMKEWRGYIKQLIAGFDGDRLSPSHLTLNKMQAIFRKWNEYRNNCKSRHVRPTYEGCLDECGNCEVCNGYQLIQLVVDAKSLESVIHNIKEQVRQKRTKSESCK